MVWRTYIYGLKGILWSSKQALNFFWKLSLNYLTTRFSCYSVKFGTWKNSKGFTEHHGALNMNARVSGSDWNVWSSWFIAHSWSRPTNKAHLLFTWAYPIGPVQPLQGWTQLGGRKQAGVLHMGCQKFRNGHIYDRGAYIQDTAEFQLNPPNQATGIIWPRSENWIRNTTEQ